MSSQSIASRGGTDQVPAWSLALASIVIVQTGAALSMSTFDSIGPSGTAFLRLLVGGMIFLVIARPRLREYTGAELRMAVVLGIVTGMMTVTFLHALERIPLATTIAIEFLGPLAVAALRSHSRRALLWPALALIGVLLLTRPWTGEIDPVGICFALASALGWATYIILTQRVGDAFSGLQGLAITIPIGACVAGIVGMPGVWGHLTTTLILQSIGLALLMPVIPFALELLALRRLTTAAFGTLMALEPAVGTVLGVVLLAQFPNGFQVAGVVLVVIAGVGAERTGHRDNPGVIEPIPTQLT